MTYTFKLARRLARLRGHGLLTAALLSAACSAGEGSLGPDAPSTTLAPASLNVLPDSASVGLNSEIQFEAVTESSANAASRGSWRWGRKLPSRLTVAPDSARVGAGNSVKFSVSGTVAGFRMLPSITWTATGGTVDTNGKYLAGAVAGRFLVIATATTGLADTAAVMVTANAPIVTSVTLTPASTSLAPGATNQFFAVGKTSGGETVGISAEYSATGGSISSAGVYRAGQAAGSYRVIATDTESGKADTSVVTITPANPTPPPPSPTLQAVVLTPVNVSLDRGATQQYAAAGRMSDGSTVTIAVSYAATGGAISSAGLYTAGQVAGGYRVIATEAGGKADTSSITVLPPPPPPSGSSACPESGYDRLVNVSNVSQLTSAVGAAQPGDQIRMAPGNYLVNLTITRSGTASRPITLCGPRSAVITNNGAYLLNRAAWWIFRGFTVTRGITGVYSQGGSHSVYDNLLIEHVGNSGIALGSVSTYNTVQNTTIRETGEATPYYGEGVYIGKGSTADDPSDNNVIRNNTFGPNIRAEHVQVVGGTTGNRVEGNISDATGFQFVANNTTTLYWTGGRNTTFFDNTLRNLPHSSMAGISSWQGSNNVIRKNSVSGVYWAAFTAIGGGGNVLGCDNIAIGGLFSNVPCTQ